MYVPTHFQENDRSEIASLVDSIPLAQLVVQRNGELVSSPLPILRREHATASIDETDSTDGFAGVPPWSFVGHLAKSNPTLASSLEGQLRYPPVGALSDRQAGSDAPAAGPALLLFLDNDAYVSPQWYPTKQATGKVVPTWNYEAVQVHGQLVLHEDPKWVLDVVSELTTRHESAFDDPWTVNDAPPAYIDAMLRAIVGIELIPTRVVAKRKLSQNRPDSDRESVVAALAEGTWRQQASGRRMPRPTL